MPEIVDKKSLERWLGDRPDEDAIVIAARAALRGLTGLALLFTDEGTDDPLAIVLPVFRASAVASVAANGPMQRQQVQKAALSAANSAAAAAWSAVDADAARLTDGIDHSALLATPLWPNAPPQGLAANWPALRDALLADDPLWRVWTDWY